jgi:hypothetical protein
MEFSTHENDASIRNYFFSRVLLFVKVDIGVRDAQTQNQDCDEDDYQYEQETAY